MEFRLFPLHRGRNRIVEGYSILCALISSLQPWARRPRYLVRVHATILRLRPHHKSKRQEAYMTHVLFGQIQSPISDARQWGLLCTQSCIQAARQRALLACSSIDEHPREQTSSVCHHEAWLYRASTHSTISLFFFFLSAITYRSTASGCGSKCWPFKNLVATEWWWLPCLLGLSSFLYFLSLNGLSWIYTYKYQLIPFI